MEVGDYVRTEDGIDVIEGYRYEPEYDNGHVVWFKKRNSGCRFTDKDMPKSSPNIIDLIEVGDYLNGYRVQELERDKNKTIIKIGYTTFSVFDGEDIYTPDYDDINKIRKLENIVTKEQFESMEYKL